MTCINLAVRVRSSDIVVQEGGSLENIPGEVFERV